MRLGNTDVTDSPFELAGSDIEGLEVVLTQRRTQVTGTVLGVDGQPAASATVVVFAEDESKLWPATRYLNRARVDSDGSFTISLPPGRYLAVAVSDLDAGEEGNPDQLRRFRPVATAVTLDDGQSQTIDLQIADIP
jgi:hypothetical protein